MSRDLELLVAENRIRAAINAYARGIDRLDFELVRNCYWPEGTDDHGGYAGGVDGFIDYVKVALARFTRTNHFLGNCLIEVDLDRNEARAETYCVAYHRKVEADGEVVDMTAGLRYVDRFERRGEVWKIARRVVAYDWRRHDRVEGDGEFGPDYVRGIRSTEDIVYHILD